MVVRLDDVGPVGEVSGGVLGNSPGADLVQLCDPGVEIRCGRVAREPERLTIVGNISPRVMLLLALIYDGNT